MLRYDGIIYHTNGHDTTNTATATRIKKKAEEIARLKQTIAICKIQLRNINRASFTDEQIAAKKSDLARLQRQLEALENRTIQHKIRKTYKKMDPAKIKAYVLKEIERAKANGMTWIVAEDIAHALQVKVHTVKNVFQQLNTEGILYQPEHHAPHDSTRDQYGYGGYSGWMADTYHFREKESEKNA